MGEAITAMQRAAIAQKEGTRLARKQYEDAVDAYATAEKVYRIALAKRLLELRAEGTAATLSDDLARGDEHIAGLRYQRDIARGLMKSAEAAKRDASEAHVRHRVEVDKIVDWSREVAPLGQYTPADVGLREAA